MKIKDLPNKDKMEKIKNNKTNVRYIIESKQPTPNVPIIKTMYNSDGSIRKQHMVPFIYKNNSYK